MLDQDLSDILRNCKRGSSLHFLFWKTRSSQFKWPLSRFWRSRSVAVTCGLSGTNLSFRFVGELYAYESRSGKESEGDETRYVDAKLSDVSLLDHLTFRELPSYFLSLLSRTYDTIEAEFDDLHHLETSPAFSAYFLTWKLLLKFFATIKTDERPAYSKALASSKILDHLMLTLLTVLPENVSSAGKRSSPEFVSEFARKMQEYEKGFENSELKSVIEAVDASQLFLESPRYENGMILRFISVSSPFDTRFLCAVISTTRYIQRYACHIFFEVIMLTRFLVDSLLAFDSCSLSDLALVSCGSSTLVQSTREEGGNFSRTVRACFPVAL